ELRSLAGTPAVLLYELRGREFPLRVLVEELHVRMARHVVEVKVILLDILAMIAFERGEAEEALLGNGIDAGPESGREDQELIAVAAAGDAILAPAVGFAAGQVVRQEAPGVASGAVIFADGRPGSVAHVWAPPAPAADVVADFPESFMLAGHDS